VQYKTIENKKINLTHKLRTVSEPIATSGRLRPRSHWYEYKSG